MSHNSSYRGPRPTILTLAPALLTASAILLQTQSNEVKASAGHGFALSPRLRTISEVEHQRRLHTRASASRSSIEQGLSNGVDSISRSAASATTQPSPPPTPTTGNSTPPTGSPSAPAAPPVQANPPPSANPPEPPPSEPPPSEDDGVVEINFDESPPPVDDDGTVQMEFDESPPSEDDDGTVQMEFGDPPAEETPPADGDSGVVQMEFGDPPADATTAPDDGGGDESGGFVFEDISEDEEALAQELQAGQVQAKGVVGTVSGVISGTDGQPVMGAYVEVQGQKYIARAGVDGRFDLKLNPGVYTLVVRFDGYEERQFAQIEVKAKETTTLDTTLTPLPGAVQTLIVEEEVHKEGQVGQTIQRQQARAARDIMSREEMSRSGGSSTSSVAQRIVGSTIIGGRYIFVRGLGHRYGNTLLDGARVPSPDPDLRTVPLDIFPTSALSAINVQKTATADVPADFTGGSVQLETREIPEHFTFKIGASIGANTRTTFQPMLTHGGHKGPDAFAFGNLPRGLDSSIVDAPEKIQLQWNPALQQWHPYTPAQIEAFGEALNTDTKISRSRNAPPNMSGNLAIGNSWAIGERGKFGLLFAGGYSNSQSTEKGLLRVFGVTDRETGELLVDTPKADYRTFQTSHEVSWNSIGLAKLQIDEYNKVNLSAMYSRDSDDQTRRFSGQSIGTSGNTNIISDRLRYIMRSVAMSQLAGEHVFPRANNLKLEWFGSFAQAQRDDPAIRDLLYLQQADGSYGLDSSAQSIRETFLKLTDYTESGAVDLSVPFRQWAQLESLFKVGGWAEGKQRDFNVRTFNMKIAEGFDDEISAMRPLEQDILNHMTIGDSTAQSAGGVAPFFVEESTQPTDNYKATQQLFAGYALIDLPLHRRFKISGGARLEHSVIEVTPINRFDPEDEGAKAKRSELTDFDIFPSASLSFSLTDTMKLRASGTQTIARPEMRELAPFQFTDFVGGFDVFGNPTLKSTHIWNGDIRWEWFPEPGEVVSATLFYKYFDNPVESVVAARPGQGLSSFRNADSAQNFGGELEIRKNIGFLAPVLRPFTLGSNFAYVYSAVKLPERGSCTDTSQECQLAQAYDASTSRERALQGQSPFVLNAFIDFDYKKSGTNVRVLYNTFGRRIYSIGGSGLPDIFEEGVHSLDARVEQALYRVPERINDEGTIIAPAKALKLTLSAKNILDAPIRFTQGEDKVVTQRVRKGASFSLGIDWSF